MRKASERGDRVLKSPEDVFGQIGIPRQIGLIKMLGVATEVMQEGGDRRPLYRRGKAVPL